jgi:hypothetical protein
MQFIFRGQFSKGLNEQTSMGVTFRGREPSEVTDAPAIAWLEGHPDYERVPEPVAEEPKRPRIMAQVPQPKKAKKSDPLDHDGNGKKGGSQKGAKATAKKKAPAK